MESEVKRLDREIAKFKKGIPQTLKSIKGVEDVYAAGFIAEIGDIKRFKSHHAVTLASYRVNINQVNLNPTKPNVQIPETNTFGTCSYKQPIKYANMIQNTKPFEIQRSTKTSTQKSTHPYC
ncbi:transposase [Bacillus sp. EB600]|nr:transposase [Bacillus sp. EB600]